MDNNGKSSYIQSQAACAIIEALGMMAENQQRAIQGESMAYVSKDFSALINYYGIDHNHVVAFLGDITL